MRKVAASRQSMVWCVGLLLEINVQPHSLTNHDFNIDLTTQILTKPLDGNDIHVLPELNNDCEHNSCL